MPENHSLLLEKKFVLQSPAPWEIKGEAILLIFRFKKKWVEGKGILPKHLKGKFKGGLGFLILGNFADTPVGPFHELLFTPGRFKKTKRQAITKCFTDSEVNTQNGHANWGIPKETLPMKWVTEKNRDTVQVSKNGNVIFTAEFESYGFSLPLSTTFFPIRLNQTWNKLNYFTRPTGFGRGKLVKVKNLDLNPELFPDIRGISPILALKINPFTMKYPQATFRDEFI